MKKSLLMLLVTMMLFGFSSFAYAAPDDGSPFSMDAYQTVPLDLSGPELEHGGQWRLEVAQEFHDEFELINALNTTSHSLRIEMLEKQGEIQDLLLQAIQSNDTDKLQASREIRQDIQEMRPQLQETNQDIRESRQAFVEAVRNHDMDNAQTNIDQWITLKSSFNDLLEENDSLLQDMIAALS